jgi:2-dehydro-3-deoxyphosphogluconate aldolase/(4S)-4-hydroxy-2-oxoglutarate aldolase
MCTGVRYLLGFITILHHEVGLMHDLTGILEKLRLVPVVGIPSVESALTLSELLLRCSLPVIEITFRTPSAVEGIKAIRQNFPEMSVLAGTVLSTDQAQEAYDSGCRAIVSPGFSNRIAGFCQKRGLPYLPGVCTPTEIHTALDAGLDLLKFFPANQAGGVQALSLFAAVFQQVRFMPTGGISTDNLVDYLKQKNVLCCGGTWLCPEKLMTAGEWGEIEKRVVYALELIR